MDGAQVDLDWIEIGAGLSFELVPRQGDQHESDQAHQKADGERPDPNSPQQAQCFLRNSAQS
jgi:hypothetical protein